MKKKIVLIALYDKLALGVRSIFSVLKKEGLDVSLIFFKELVNNNNKPPSKIEKRKLIELLKKLKPDIIGFSLRSGFFKTAVDLTNEVKKEIDSLIVWGGIHPTICPEECLKYVDIICRGEGEYPMLELTQIKNNFSWSKPGIENLWTKDQQNKIRPLIDLNKLPLPIYDKNNEYMIDNNTIYRGTPILEQVKYVAMATRGCPFNCSYCGNNSLKKLYPHEKFVRWRSVDSLIEELLEVKKNFRNLNGVFFVDEMFVSDIKWLKEFTKKYKKEINLPFEVDLYPNLVTEEMIVLLKSAGLRKVVTGIQSGSKEILRDVYKRHTFRESILSLHKILLKHKIKVDYDVIMDTPFGGEKETLDLLLELKKPFALHLYSLTHFPKTDLTELLLSRGAIGRNDIEDFKAKALDSYFIKFSHNSWNSLISLTSNRFIPKRFVRFLSCDYFIARPRLLAIPANVSRFMRLVYAGTAMFFRGELNFLIVKKRLKNLFSANYH